MTKQDIFTKVVIPLVAAFGGAALSGFLVWHLDPNWDIRARQEGWIPATQCPTNPLVLEITGPGNDSVVPVYSDRLGTPVIVNASRPLAEHERLGLIHKL